VSPAALSLDDAAANQARMQPLGDAKPGPLQSSLTLARDAVEVSTSQDDSNVSVQISRGDNLDVDTSHVFTQGTTRKSAYESWSLTLKAPVNKKEDTTELANLDGLANAFTASLKYNRYYLMRRNPTDDELRPVCDPANCDSAEVKKRLGQAGYDRWHALFFSPYQYGWGGAATVGTQSYEFIEHTGTAKLKQHQTPWSLQLFGGVERTKVGLFTVSLRYEDAYKAQDSGTNCPTGATTAVVNCVTDPIGAPKKKESAIAALEFRRSMTWSGHPVALAPSVSYDFHAEVVGVEFPFYLWADSKGKLTGGVKVGWRDDKGGISVGLFVGAPFTWSLGK
jgi:hypothetical protein